MKNDFIKKKLNDNKVNVKKKKMSKSQVITFILMIFWTISSVFAWISGVLSISNNKTAYADEQAPITTESSFNEEIIDRLFDVGMYNNILYLEPVANYVSDLEENKGVFSNLERKVYQHVLVGSFHMDSVLPFAEEYFNRLSLYLNSRWGVFSLYFGARAINNDTFNGNNIRADISCTINFYSGEQVVQSYSLNFGGTTTYSSIDSLDSRVSITGYELYIDYLDCSNGDYSINFSMFGASSVTDFVGWACPLYFYNDMVINNGVDISTFVLNNVTADIYVNQYDRTFENIFPTVNYNSIDIENFYNHYRGDLDQGVTVTYKFNEPFQYNKFKLFVKTGYIDFISSIVFDSNIDSPEPITGRLDFNKNTYNSFGYNLVANTPIANFEVNSISFEFSNSDVSLNDFYFYLLTKDNFTIYNTGFNDGRADFSNNTDKYSFFNLISALVDVPIQTFTGLLNFKIPILDINLYNLAQALITIAVIIFIVRLLV